jgi:hypothetical protein
MTFLPSLEINFTLKNLLIFRIVDPNFYGYTYSITPRMQSGFCEDMLDLANTFLLMKASFSSWLFLIIEGEP